MKHFTLLNIFLLIGIFGKAQPVNDDCVGLIDLGVAPICPSSSIYTNVDATASNIGADNIPDCFNGGLVDRDVWFVFTTDNMITDYTITVTGVPDGMGSTPIVNPQIEVYRGDCMFDGLASLQVCTSALPGESVVTTNIFGLDLNTQYFIRVNDYTSTASPNSGSFEFCIDEYIPDLNICDVSSTTSCTGTLYDCGGPDGDYGNNENFTFTICPNDFFECITIDMVDYNIEPNNFGFGDILNIYAGDNNTFPLIASVTGTSDGSTFEIFASSPCVTIEFISDGFTTNEGFELTWACNAFPCVGSSPDNPTVINSVPYNNTGLTTCTEGSTIGESPCPDDNFLGGPDYVFTYDSPGDECVSVSISGAQPGTGVLVLNGPPGDPGTTCVAVNIGGMIGSANMSAAGTYYIIVANAGGCTDFDINIEAADCNLSPALVDALCNPLNGCQEFDMDGMPLPSVFNLDIGFEDMAIVGGLNNGCYLGVGAGNFYWFTIQAQAAGDFGFIVQGANFPSDIDLSVWGPFTEGEVCETPADVIDFITNNQPIRSSWTGGTNPTGLADIHPVSGIVVTDEFDCGSPATPGAGGDGVVTTIPTQLDEVYVVLINDWGGAIIDGTIEVDWSPSDPEVLEPLPIEVIGGDTTICIGESAQIEIAVGIADIEWISNTNTLSCTNCPNPIATPTETTIYLAVVDGVCINDTVGVKVGVYQVDAGPDVTVCLGEDIQIVAGSNYDDATYEWTGPNLSCTDCPDPFITGVTAGTFTYSVTLFTPNCTLTDEMDLTVLTAPAPIFSVVADSVELCIGDNTNLGNPSNDASNTYAWSSVPSGFNSADPNPIANPTETTTYYVEVTNGLCPVSSFDSVFVEVFSIPVISLEDDTTVCQGEMVLLGNTILEEDVVYNWSPNIGLDFDTIPNPTAIINSTQTYTLTATNGACVITESVTVTSTVISVELQNPDSLIICRGEAVSLNAIATPFGTEVTWIPNNGTINPPTGNNVVATPQTATTYYAEVSVPGCVHLDSIYIDVDSIPLDLQILPSDTSVCAGSIVILQTTTYEQSDFPDIEHQWQPNIGFQSPDSLLNMVIEANEPVLYTRTTTNGVCTQIDTALITIFTPTSIEITPSDTMVCTGESVQLLASSPDVTEYTWTPGDGTLSCIECPNPVASPTTSSTYTVLGEFEDCPIEASVQIQVVPNPVAEVIGDTEICIGVSIVLNQLQDTYPGTTWNWTSDPFDPTLDTNIPLPEVTPLETTTYTLFVTNGVCDTLVQQVTITVVNDAILTVSADVTICEGESATLTASSTEPGSFLWSNTGTDDAITVNPDNTDEYSVIFSNSCSDLYDTIIVNVIEVVDVTILSDPDPILDTIQEGEIVTLTAVLAQPINGAVFSWSTGQTGQTITTPAIAPSESYSVTVTTAEGCEYVATIDVDAIPADFAIPNVFTPDGDDANDFFNVSSKGNVEIRDFKIFNRWGQLVYNNENPGNGWDGTFKGENAPSDVYIYMITIDMPSGVVRNEKGDLTLIR
jgi:gliding motility-associated-like protein